MTNKSKNINADKSIILFDGVCNLCNGFVNFIIDRDQENKFKFGSLQSTTGQLLLAQHGLLDGRESVVLVEHGNVYKESSAVLRIAKRLGMPWSLFYGFLIIPTFIRDAVYRFVARNRYRWFGKQDTCRVPTPELKNRFLE